MPGVLRTNFNPFYKEQNNMFAKILAFVMAAPQHVARANDNDALIPEVWAPEALMTLMSNTIMASLVHRDFSADVASFGDVVNTSRPADFTGERKTDLDNVTDQDAVSANIRVPLDQHFHISFVINDGELTKALPDLLQRYMEPAARELAESIDRVLTGQAAQLLANQVGEADSVTSLNVDEYVLDADQSLNDNRAPKSRRYLVMSSRFNRAALGAEIVTHADKRGDGGAALEDARVGKIYGFDSFMDQNVPYVDVTEAETDVGVTDGAESKGDTVIEATNLIANVLNTGGEYITIEGSPYLHRVSSAAADTLATDFTLVEGLKADVASGAAVTLYMSCDVDASAQTGSVFAAGYSKRITLDGFAANKGPQVGQIITFDKGASSHSYTVIAVTETSTTVHEVLLDRPLDAAVADAAVCFPGPAGSRNLGFTRDAIALVSRPLVLVPSSSGANSAVANFDGLSMRVTMQYDSKAQGHRVTFDLLCGVAILDERLAVVVNS